MPSPTGAPASPVPSHSKQWTLPTSSSPSPSESFEPPSSRAPSASTLTTSRLPLATISTSSVSSRGSLKQTR